MWSDRVFYQIYPLGFCGAPYENDGIAQSRILHVLDWIAHMQKLGINALYFSPVFESDSHGYNTRDYLKIDTRLGTNEDFAKVCKALHEAGIRVVLDGVFNHVGRGFFAFEDVRKNREQSQYLDWFYRIDFGGDTEYHDGFWYEGWEGYNNMVKLNLRNPAVVDYLLSAVGQWIDEFDIDGLRLDVAYSLDHDFIRRLRAYCDAKKDDFFLVGEMLHGDYNQLTQPDMLHSVTNYECYKGLYSSCNSHNLFEIVHSLLRQFGPEEWTLYKGKKLLNFVDNHDTERVASILQNPNHLKAIYALMIAMPGIPCIYYGSEWGAEGKKGNEDRDIRKYYETPVWNDLTEWIAGLIRIRKDSSAIREGAFYSVVLTNEACVFLRETEGERIYVCVNISDREYYPNFEIGAAYARNLISNERIVMQNGFMMQPYQCYILKPES
ncbi:MAG: cyclomaltodextrinase [Agathobacter sp.]|uniref:alpha-amylase family glycosyl hydrolase n=1 Tax=Agathobacter sp. TaxID=2021311 RepID=UPI00258F4740|nr:alpha-amylase family glycosyl hydrolase [Agathobacter sp.]MCR5676678.1 cyclomaltodextrinase [Agathobacter sp.]